MHELLARLRTSTVACRHVRATSSPIPIGIAIADLLKITVNPVMAAASSRAAAYTKKDRRNHLHSAKVHQLQ